MAEGKFEGVGPKRALGSGTVAALAFFPSKRRRFGVTGSMMVAGMRGW